MFYHVRKLLKRGEGNVGGLRGIYFVTVLLARRFGASYIYVKVMNMQRNISYYVRDRRGVCMLLCSVVVEDMYARTEVMRTELGRSMGIRGWNYVVVGSLNMYAEEGPGFVSGDVECMDFDGVVYRMGVKEGSVGECCGIDGYEYEVYDYKE